MVTSVELEHTEVLGEDVALIAAEKAGIASRSGTASLALFARAASGSGRDFVSLGMYVLDHVRVRRWRARGAAVARGASAARGGGGGARGETVRRAARARRDAARWRQSLRHAHRLSFSRSLSLSLSGERV